jgi:pimeloyl-ACP methyl ester carboxylesterase
MWLRQSPYWAGITLFSESHRVENFRAMDRVFPARAVPRAGDVWAFDHAPAPLPDTYTFEGEARDLAAFLDRTETTGLLIVHRGAITHEDYRQGADETSPFTSWSMAKSVLSALIGIALEEGHIDSIRDPIGAYVPALAGSGYGDVPMQNLRAVVAAAPGFGFGFDAAEVAGLDAAIQLWGAAEDERVPPATNITPLATALRVPSEAHIIQGAGHFAFRPPCNPALEQANPRVWEMACVDAPDFDREAFQQRFNKSVVGFLIKILIERYP